MSLAVGAQAAKHRTPPPHALVEQEKRESEGEEASGVGRC